MHWQIILELQANFAGLKFGAVLSLGPVLGGSMFEMSGNLNFQIFNT